MSFRYLLLVFCFTCVNSDIYNVKIATDHHVNLVDSKFLSFTLDPKYLFASSGKLYSSQQCKCMASALSPAYLRIAGPSTSRISYRNNTVIIDEDKGSHNADSQIKVSQRHWEKFLKWSKVNGFDLVFAVNNDAKTGSGVWDSHSALSILSVADRAGVEDMFWELGYECKNQTIEEYLNDLETLRIIAESFPRKWKVVGGDVTPCLREGRSDFKDYVMLSNDMMDAILLNGNSSSQELERMTERDRKSLLRALSKSDVPLWLTENSQYSLGLERAAEWLASLGFAARNGFSIHYRELVEEELYEPTLSFYMALLFKNLVGERVLDVDMSVSKASLFAHCTSLHHKPIPGALTLYGANMDDEPARFSLRLSKREEGGDVMQFILGHDEEGNIVVNSHVMYYEGDIRPVVKHVRPYKTLLINLPPKSFGFWVLANTQVEACRDLNYTQDGVDIVSLSQEQTRKVKRSLNNNDRIDYLDEEYIDVSNNGMPYENVALKGRIDSINRDLKRMQSLFQTRMNEDALNRLRRHVNSNKYNRRDKKVKNRFDNEVKLNSGLVRKLLDITELTQPLNDVIKRVQRNNNVRRFKRTKKLRKDKPIKSKLSETFPKKEDFENKKKITGKQSVNSQDLQYANKNSYEDNLLQKDDNEVTQDYKLRKRRSISNQRKTIKNEISSENDIELDSKENIKFSKILRKIKKMSKLPLEVINGNTENDDFEESDDNTNAIILKTKVEDDGATIQISENPNFGFIASTLEDFLALLSDLNQNLKKAWGAMSLLR